MRTRSFGLNWGGGGGEYPDVTFSTFHWSDYSLSDRKLHMKEGKEKPARGGISSLTSL